MISHLTVWFFNHLSLYLLCVHQYTLAKLLRGDEKEEEGKGRRKQRYREKNKEKKQKGKGTGKKMKEQDRGNRDGTEGAEG